MKRVADYLQNARDCRALARNMPEAQRQQLLRMAEQWESIAREREDTLLRAPSLPIEDPPSSDNDD